MTEECYGKDDVLRRLKELIRAFEPCPDKYDTAVFIYDVISALPVKKIEKVPRGKWVVDDNGVVYCSECFEEHEWVDYRASYCDNCGAKME